ncbi:MAG: hypothetical protein KAR42_02265 [candidate division Zixibacteria bacterium]|nr:hypothetical protein [candidate division Zixibacteria bacterium]
MRRIIFFLIFTVFTVGLSAPVAAQRGDWHGGPHGGRGRHSGDFDKKAKGFEQLRLLKMMEALDLTDEQSGQFIKVFYNHRKMIKNIRLEKMQIVDSIYLSLDIENAEADIKRLIKRLHENARKQDELISQFFTDCEGILNAYQLGKLAIFHDRFEREILESLWRGRRGDLAPPDSAMSDGK